MKQEDQLLHRLSTGEAVYLRPTTRTIFVAFKRPRKVISTSLLNGGYREDITGVFNHNSGPDNGTHCQLRAGTYVEHMKIIAAEADLRPEQTTGMGTAAQMENAAVVVKTYQELVVTAIATAGVEGNGGRVGDPAGHYNPGQVTGTHKSGTINIFLHIDADMPPGTLARALVTCTEAKTAALQELMVGSLYSTGLATGSGTDQTVIVANPDSSLYFEGAGKHNKLGELIGLAVQQAVTEALQKQNSLCPNKQHSVLRRMKRFGISEDSLWQRSQEVIQKQGEDAKKVFLQALYTWEKEADAVTYTSLYVHLLDQLQWQLLGEAEALSAGNEIINLLAVRYDAKKVNLIEGTVSSMTEGWERLILACVVRPLF
ncbi:MAG: adenosylcobinamide amidohydrolase [Sporomusaceae bacterium]|nr:adenosylcobinamide amidohydrolase [Sporomusaceae bacterium]